MSSKKRRKGAMADVVPAALAHIGGVIRAKAGLEPEFGRDGDRIRTLTFSTMKGDDSIVITVKSVKSRDRWGFGGISGTKNGVDMDLKDDLKKALELLGGPQELGTPGGSAVAGVSGAKRDRGVEVRATTVIRT